MIFRKCSTGYEITLFRAPYGVAEMGVLKPKGRFCVVVMGKMVYDGDDFPKAEKRLVNACKKYHKPDEKQHGRMKLGKSKIIDRKSVEAEIG